MRQMTKQLSITSGTRWETCAHLSYLRGNDF